MTGERLFLSIALDLTLFCCFSCPEKYNIHKLLPGATHHPPRAGQDHQYVVLNTQKIFEVYTTGGTGLQNLCGAMKMSRVGSTPTPSRQSKSSGFLFMHQYP